MTPPRWAGAALAVLLALCTVGTGASAQPAHRAKRQQGPLPGIGAHVEFVQGSAVSTLRRDALRKGSKARATTDTSPTAPAPVAVAVPIVNGSTLAEGAVVQVPEDGYLRLRLADGSVVRVLADSDIELKRLRRRGSNGPVETVIDVRRGKVESEVAPKQKGRVFEIHAPGAVASVRGTRFDVAVDAGTGQVGLAVTEGTVRMQGRSRQKKRLALVSAGSGVLVDAGGRLGEQRALPPPPDLSTLPTEYADADALLLDLGALPSLARAREVRIASDGDLSRVVRSTTSKASPIRFAPLDDGNYTVGVRLVDHKGLAGPEARREIRILAHPVPPLYLAPPPAGRVTSEAGHLACLPPAGVSTVHLQVTRGADFSQPLVDLPQLSGCRFGLASLPPGEYSWRVASIAGSGAANDAVRRGPFAARQSFVVVTVQAIGAFEPPADSDTPTLRWGLADAAAPAAAVRFHAEVARDAQFAQVLQSADLDSASWTLRGLPRGLYFVRLQTVDASGLTGPFSPPYPVHVGARLLSGSGEGVTSSDGEPISRP